MWAAQHEKPSSGHPTGQVQCQVPVISEEGEDRWISGPPWPARAQRESPAQEIRRQAIEKNSWRWPLAATSAPSPTPTTPITYTQIFEGMHSQNSWYCQPDENDSWWSWRGGSAIKSPGCSCREPRFDSQHSHGSQLPVTPVLGDLTPHFWPSQAASPHVVHTHTQKQAKHSYVKLNILN